MNLTDIAGIVFVCVTANHLGLISTAERILDRKLWIVDCPKCASFWSVLIYTLISTRDFIISPAISFLASYTAIWLELFEGFIDTLYVKLYETIYPTDTDTTAPDADYGSPEGSVS